jgi:hypothetical protein
MIDHDERKLISAKSMFNFENEPGSPVTPDKV